MCGIAGIAYNYNLNELQCITNMTTAIQSRGPDDSGIWIDQEFGVAFGHRRLSILDLSSAGHQPMHSASKRYVISYNGEIYNYLDIRKELDAYNKKLLEKPEYVFLSKSDLVSEKEVTKKVKALKAITREVIAISIHDVDKLKKVEQILRKIIKQKY